MVRDDGDHVGFVGVSYLEMKRRGNTGFPTIDAAQLHRILRRVPGAPVGFQEPNSDPYVDCVHDGSAGGRIAVLPMAHVADSPMPADRLCRFSTTLGHQLAVRFLNGADLEMDVGKADSLAWALQSEYVAIVSAGLSRTIEEIVKKSAVIKRKIEDYEDIRTAMRRMRDGRSDGRTI